MIVYPMPTDVPRTDDVWAHMVSQGSAKSSLKMAEGSIPHVHRFLRHPEFSKALARGVTFEIILTNQPQTDTEKLLMGEIALFTQTGVLPVYDEAIPFGCVEQTLRDAHEQNDPETAVRQALSQMGFNNTSPHYHRCLSLVQKVSETKTGLQPLDQNHIDAMYGRAETNETVFRNTFLDLADNDEERQLFKNESLDTLFEQYVDVSGKVTRIGDFRVGLLGIDYALNGSFPQVLPNQLAKNEALVVIDKPECSWLKLYEILEDSSVRFGRSETPKY